MMARIQAPRGRGRNSQGSDLKCHGFAGPPGRRGLRRPEAVAEYFRSTRTAFPDQRNENAVLRHADDSVIVEFDLVGTHEGEIRGIPGTGSSFRCRACALFLFGDGDRIVCERVYFDQATIAEQIFNQEAT